jgi:hypothetical protein
MQPGQRRIGLRSKACLQLRVVAGIFRRRLDVKAVISLERAGGTLAP